MRCLPMVWQQVIDLLNPLLFFAWIAWFAVGHRVALLSRTLDHDCQERHSPHGHQLSDSQRKSAFCEMASVPYNGSLACRERNGRGKTALEPSTPPSHHLDAANILANIISPEGLIRDG